MEQKKTKEPDNQFLLYQSALENASFSVLDFVNELLDQLWPVLYVNKAHTEMVHKASLPVIYNHFTLF